MVLELAMSSISAILDYTIGHISFMGTLKTDKIFVHMTIFVDI